MGTENRSTSTDYQRPHRAAVVRWANAVCQAVGWRSSLDPERLCRTAQRREGLEDFGEPDVLEPLSQLVESIERDAALHPVGRYLTRERLLSVLQNRLRIRENRVEERRAGGQWLVICGLQRTGTTYLQRLLAADPNTRALRSWEALAPAPPRGRDTRVASARRAQSALRFLAPDFFAVHPVEAEGVEEDSLLLDLSLYSPVAEATLRVPTYARWLESCDMRPAYRLLREVLSLLEPEGRWVLKSPAHLPFLDVLAEAAPDVRVVMTHRDPVATLPSYCSMIAHGRGVFSDAIDPHAIGREFLDRQSAMIQRALELREERPALEVLDVHYDAVVEQPLTVVEAIYRFAGWTFDESARTAVEAVIASHTQHRFGRHRYTLSDFGLTEAQLRTAYGAYYRRLTEIDRPEAQSR